VERQPAGHREKGLSLENYFLRYAFPCTYVIKQRGEIDDSTFRKIENAAMKNRKLERKLLEKVYKNAFRRIRVLAKEMKKSRWNIDVIREYFVKRHNMIIMEGEGNYAKAPAILKELCKVRKAEIIEKRDGFFIVKYRNGRGLKTRVVGSHFVPDAKKGDSVFIHHGFAVEMAS
jgi:hypothetical protein